MQPQRRQPTRLPHPCDSPGKNIGVGCYFLLQRMNSTSQNHQDHQKQGRSEKLSQASLVAQTVKNLPAVQETKVQSLVWEDSLEKEMVIHSSILA